MRNRNALTFKIACEESEYGQIHRLNYQTFVEEIPQRPANPARSLVDVFHTENTYVIGLQQDTLVGMVAVRGQRPFSLDAKLADLDSYLPVGHSLCECRLLAIQPQCRNSAVFGGLLSLVTEHCREKGYTLALISATLRQLKLYRHLGFVAFGPVVGTPEAPYQPMYLTEDAYRAKLK
jgi:hypothetical protein